MISLEDMVEALVRWQDFNHVRPEPSSRLVTSFEGYEGWTDDEEQRRDEMIEAIANQELGAGLTDDAGEAFWVSLPELLNGLSELPQEIALKQAARIGLVVGLTARQFEEDRKQDR